jgi:ParB/RepB/Spo0J family partition protein
MVALAEISPSPDNPRTGMTDASLQDLAESIKEQGLIEPVIVRPIDNWRATPDTSTAPPFILVAGERRWRASQLAQLEEIPAIIRWDLDRAAALELTVIENFQRQDLNPMDEARGFQALQQVAGLTQKQIAERIGASQPAIANRLRLLEFPQAIQEMLTGRALSSAQGIALLRYRKQLDDDQLLLAAREVVADHWTVKQIEYRVPGLGDMEVNGRAAFVGHYFRGWQAACEKCPFNAMTQIPNGGIYCLKPEHAVELQTAWEAEKEAQQATGVQDAIAAAQAVVTGQAIAEPVAPQEDADEEMAPDGPQDGDTAADGIAVAPDSGTTPPGDSEPATEANPDEGPVPANLVNLWDKLPYIEMLPWDSYERLSPNGGSCPPGCTDQCACRGLARSKSLDYPIPVCFDPKRLSGLRAAATRAANKNKAADLANRLGEMQALLDKKNAEVGWLSAADLAMVVAQLLRSGYTFDGAFKRAAERRGLEWNVTNYALAGYRLEPDSEGAQQLQELLHLGAPALLQIILEGMFELDVKDAVQYGGKDTRGMFAWWKEHQGTAAKPQKEKKSQ